MIVLRSYKLKVKPNKTQLQKLNNYFYEAKCLYNFVLATEDVFHFDTKVKTINKLDKDGNTVAVLLDNLPAKLRQNVVHSLQDSIRHLSKTKKSGRKVGRLKYKSEVTCIKLDNQCFSLVGNKLKLSGMYDTPLRVRGLSQLEGGIKTHNAWLLRHAGNYYISICCEKAVKHINTGRSVGIDMGIKDNIVLSTGEKYTCSIGESERTKRLQKKIAKSKKGSKNRSKLCLRLRKANTKTSNKKQEFVNQLVHRLDVQFDKIVWQDELISKWKKSRLRGFGSKIQHSCLGMFKQKLQQRQLEEPNRFVQLESKYPTTQLCPVCGSLNKHTLDKRTYSCTCGYTCDRDIHAARNMLVFAQRFNLKIPQELRKLTPVEKKASMFKQLLNVSHASMKQETQSLLV